MALPIGVGLSLSLAWKAGSEEINTWVSDGIKRASSILAIVGAGGALGSVLQATGIGEYLGQAALGMGLPSILIPFLVATMIKTGQGSSVATMITAPAIVLPILPALGLSAELATMAVCAGALICVTVNDSFFWVVTGFTGMEIATGFKTLTAMTLLQGAVAITTVIALSYFIH